MHRQNPGPAHGGIVVKGVVKAFDDVAVLRGIDLAVEPGTALALLGRNGAGKTTTVRILTTLLRPDGGSATVGGFDVVRQPAQVRTVLALTGQNTSVDELLTGRENLVMMGRLLRLGRRPARHRANELLEQFDLQNAADRSVKTYSSGMRRRLDLAASMTTIPAVMFLDEPTTGLDPVARQQVWGTIRQLIASGTTVLLTTQYLEEADQLADRIAVIDDGRIIVEGTPDSLKRQVGSERAELTFVGRQDFQTARHLLKESLSSVGESALRMDLTIDDPWNLYTLLGRLHQAGVKPTGLTVSQPTLDDVFFRVTGNRKTGDSWEQP
jgi:daunorubicin resistance ABC transporter ATP-binding subunit